MSTALRVNVKGLYRVSPATHTHAHTHTHTHTHTFAQKLPNRCMCSGNTSIPHSQNFPFSWEAPIFHGGLTVFLCTHRSCVLFLCVASVTLTHTTAQVTVHKLASELRMKIFTSSLHSYWFCGIIWHMCTHLPAPIHKHTHHSPRNKS